MISRHLTDPRGHVLETSVWLPRPPDEVFAFFGDALQLEAITPPWLRFAVLTPAPIAMQPGALIDYRLRLRGFPIRWRSEISAWDPPRRFVDRQIRGPYRYWIHEHTFEPRDGGTQVGDRVEYAVPGGALLHRLFVRDDLERIFRFRQNVLRQVFAGGPQTSATEPRPK